MTAVLTIGADGHRFQPFFIKSQVGNASLVSGRRPPPGQQPVKGMTKEIMKLYIDDLVKQLQEPSVLIMDRLSAHTSKVVQTYIKSAKLPDGRKALTPLLLPAKTAFLISPLDMGAIAAFKSHYYKFDRSTPSLKLFAARQAWSMISSDHIKNFFQNCGIIGEWKSSELNWHIISQVQSGVPEELEEIQDFYDSWKSGAVVVEGATARRVHEDTVPLQLPEGELDGVYWHYWGPHGKTL